MKPLPDTLPRDLTVLLVDSDSHARHLLRQFLLELGVRNLLFAASAQEAADLQQACSGPLDLVLSELHLPDMDGLALFRQLQMHQPGLTFILVTWDTAEEAVRRGQEAGLGGYLAKPVSPEQLQEKIVGALLRDRSYKSRTWLRSAEGQAFQDDASPEMRALFDIWDRARGQNAMPPRAFLNHWDLRSGGPVERHLFIVHVEPPKPRLRYSFVGAALSARLGMDVVGRCVDEQHFLYRRYAQPAYDRVIRQRVPHYRRIGAIERMMMFRYQRLLLPFGDETGVQTVLGCARPR